MPGKYLFFVHDDFRPVQAAHLPPCVVIQHFRHIQVYQIQQVLAADKGFHRSDDWPDFLIRFIERNLLPDRVVDMLMERCQFLPVGIQMPPDVDCLTGGQKFQRQNIQRILDN